LTEFADMIAACFCAPTVEEIVARVDAHAGRSGAGHVFAARMQADLARGSPAALKVTFRHVREAAALDLRQVLMRDTRLAAALLEGREVYAAARAVLGGARAAVFLPDRLEGVTPAMVERYFATKTHSGDHLPTRREMQASRV
jgi:enoyl-CoA hydratase